MQGLEAFGLRSGCLFRSYRPRYVASMNRERELWGMALWVEKAHGDDGTEYILDRIAKLQRDGEEHGVELWSEVFDRFMQLRPPGVEFS